VTKDDECPWCCIRKVAAGGLICAICTGLIQYGPALRPGAAGHPAAGGAPGILADSAHDETPRGGPFAAFMPETYVTGSTTPTNWWGPDPGGL